MGEHVDEHGSVIRVEHISKVYTSGTTDGIAALHNIDIDIDEGEFVSLVGPSGCGKSTLLNIMAGLLPPSEGRVMLDGTALDEPSRDVAIMFQSPVLFPWRTAVENVLLPAEIFGWDRKEYRDRAVELLSMLGLSGFEGSYPAQLSGGMQQRVAMCRVLLYDPKVLLLDEPFGSLDEFTREAINVELARIWQMTGKTIVLVTHNINEAVFLSGRVVVVAPRPGRVIASVSVGLPLPRSLDSLQSPEYLAKVLEVREALGLRRGAVEGVDRERVDGEGRA